MTRFVGSLVVLALSPLLLLQALYVVARAIRLPEAAGERAGRAGMGPDLRVLILGDSAAAGVGVARQADALSGQLVDRLTPDFAVAWSLQATTGHRTRQAIAALDGLQGQAFDVAVISLGVNDVTSFQSVRDWIAAQRELHATLRARHGVRLIVTAPLPPMGDFPLLPQPLRGVIGRRARAFDASLRTYAAGQTDIAIADFDLPNDPALMAPDGYHPGPGVYAAWATAVARVIRERFGAG